LSRVALVHDWLTGMRGGEKVLDAICELYPEAPLYTLVRVRGSVSPRIEGRRITTSIAQWLPAAGRAYRQYLPVFPAAVEMWDLDRYDLVISTSHCAAKSVVRAGRAVHVCYCHSPMRYAWDQFPAYFGPDRVGAFRHRLLRPVMAGLARWDRATAGRVDRYVANSRYVAARIRRYYNRGSTVVYPPVDTTFYRPTGDRPPSDSGFLIVSALVAYKRLDVAIEACRRVGAPLTIVGKGPELGRLRQLAGPDVTFRGWLPDEDIRALYQGTTAVLLPGVEDFGLVPVEAQACGAPVVALGRGGARESVLHGQTGILVDDDSVEAFAEGLHRVRELNVDRTAIRRHAETFSRERFLREFKGVVQDAASTHQSLTTNPPGDGEDAASRHRSLTTNPTPVEPGDGEDAASRHRSLTRNPTPVQPAAREDEQ
jgi:glycosyltransferase involved in cell wall biosynthesis